MHFLMEFKKEVSDSVNFNSKLPNCMDTATNLLESEREFMNKFGIIFGFLFVSEHKKQKASTEQLQASA